MEILKESNCMKIAVIGVSCRFPGANNPQEFWSNLIEKRVSVRSLNDSELKRAGVAQNLIDDTRYVKKKGTIENINSFDANLFGYSTRDATFMDPQLKLLHELSWEAMEDANIMPRGSGSEVGVFVCGTLNGDWIENFSGNCNPAELFEVQNVAYRDFFSTRISYSLGLKGPSLNVQTGCSSSLVAVHLAIQSLLAGDCEAAVAGGVSITSPSEKGYLHEDGMIGSSDGYCKSFDVNADGAGRSDGGGIVVLKLLEDAVENGDNIYAVIRASAVNNDGAEKVGYTAPGLSGQVDVVRKAIDAAEICSSSVSFIEAHGSATKIGDLIEVSALSKAYQDARTGSCALGSVKANLGHLDAAAGIAGLIKVCLSLSRSVYPGQPNFSSPNPNLKIEASPFFVARENLELHSIVPLRAGLSSLGVGGTNVHMILEKYEEPQKKYSNPDNVLPFLLSASTKTSLLKNVRSLLDFVKTLDIANHSLPSISRSLREGRANLKVRHAFCAKDKDELTKRLETLVDGRSHGLHENEKNRPIIFLFSGNGSQYFSMGRGLYEKNEIFRRKIDHFFGVARSLSDFDFPRHWFASMSDSLDGVEGDISIMHPLLFAVEYALANLLTNIGINPDYLIGYSFGEITAACIANVFSFEDGIKLVMRRSKLAKTVEKTSMLSVPLASEEIRNYLDERTFVSIDNSDSCVLVGPIESMIDLKSDLAKRKVLTQEIPNAYPFHSDLMSSISEGIKSSFYDVELRRQELRVISSLTGNVDADLSSPQYWVDQLASQQRFGDAIRFVRDNVDDPIFIEIGPSGELAGLILRCIPGNLRVVSPVRRRTQSVDDYDLFMRACASLWMAGKQIEWSALLSGGRYQFRVPTYNFDRLVFPTPLKKLEESPRDRQEFSNWFYKPYWRQNELKRIGNYSFDLFVFISDNGGSFTEVSGINLDHSGINRSIFVACESLENDADNLISEINLYTDIQYVNVVFASGILSRKNEFDVYNEISRLIKNFIGGIDKKIRLVVLNSNSVSTMGNDLIFFEKFLAASAVKVVNQEYNKIRAKYIDIDSSHFTGETISPWVIERIVREFGASFDGQIISYRGKARWVLDYESIDDIAIDNGAVCDSVRVSGTYLLVGGLGGMGIAIAKDLMRRFDAKVVITTRRKHDDALNRIINTEFSGVNRSNLKIVQADALDVDRMRSVIDFCKENFGGINGVVFCAGIAGGRLIQNSDELESRRVMAVKVDGPKILAGLIGNDCVDFVVYFSSLDSIIGVIGQMDYTAANMALDSFCAYKDLFTDTNSTKHICINWYAWKSAGMSVDAAKRIPGYMDLWFKHGLNEDEGLRAFYGALNCGETQVIVSPLDIHAGILAASNSEQVLTSSIEQQRTGANVVFSRPSLSVMYSQPENSTELELSKLWMALFNYDQVGRLDDFYELGGDSLKGIILASKIRAAFDYDISMRDFFSDPTIKGVAALIVGKSQKKEKLIGLSSQVHSDEIPRCNAMESYPASSAQKRMFVLWQLAPNSTAYNYTFGYRVTGNIDKSKLQRALTRIVERHESLRTTFQYNDGCLRQYVSPPYQLAPKVYDIDFDSIEGFVSRIATPFDLTRDMLFRAYCVSFSDLPNEFLLIFDLHHIICDGSSAAILIEEINSLYSGGSLDEPELQYRDYAVWFSGYTQEKMKAHEDYWLTMFSSGVPKVIIPSDHERAGDFKFSGATIQEKLSDDIICGISRLGVKNATLFSVVLSAYYILLHKYSASEEITVGFGISGRKQSQLLRVVGMFVNMIAAKVAIQPGDRCSDFIAVVSQMLVECYDHQEAQFDVLVKKLNLSGSLSQNPLFNVAIVSENMEIPRLKLGDAVCNEYALFGETAKFDITLIVRQRSDESYLCLEYATDIFSQGTARTLLKKLIAILHLFCEDLNRTVGELPLSSLEEKRQIAELYSEVSGLRHAAKYRNLFKECVEKNAENTALVFSEKSMTYRELDLESNKMARLILERLDGCDRSVAIIIEPCLGRIVSVIAAIKAGIRFIPIDPRTPVHRVCSILSQSQSDFLITSKNNLKVANELLWGGGTIKSYLLVDSIDATAEVERDFNPLMDAELWDQVASDSQDEIEIGGWKNSATNELMTRSEMSEYAKNSYLKLKKFITPDSKILELGCSSGITMLEILPFCRQYVALDLSQKSINFLNRKLQGLGYKNFNLYVMDAMQIDCISDGKFDLVILNSVIQCFVGHNYLIEVIKRSIGKMKEDGVIFIGDVMDLEKKDSLISSLKEKKLSGFNAKTDFSSELFLTKKFFDNLKSLIPEISSCEISNKIFSINNELTDYRYDVILTISKSHGEAAVGEAGKSRFGIKDIDGFSDGYLDADMVASAPIYTIFTSGTTGKPKGVTINNGALVNLCAWHNESFSVSKGDRATQLSSFSFDASIWETLPYLIAGATVFVVENEISSNASVLASYLKDNSITICFLPTNLYEVIDKQELNISASLRVVLVGGDQLHSKSVPRSVDRSYALYNNYGPTECAVVATSHLVGDCAGFVPIGKPIAGTRAYVVDEYFRIQPIGMPGEICITGAGLADGYLSTEETSAAFLHDRGDIDGRFYRTGDRGRLQPDGDIEYLGRLDSQVKVRGFRIELKEIECVAREYPGVVEAALVVIGESLGRSLMLFVSGFVQLELAAFRRHLECALPEYMIPAQIVVLDKLPITINGKIDTVTLQRMAGEAINSAPAAFDRPLDWIESGIVGIWETVLEHKNFSVGEDFFRVGGHSLTATMLLYKIKDFFNVNIKLVDVFNNSSVLAMSELVRNQLRLDVDTIGNQINDSGFSSEVEMGLL